MGERNNLGFSLFKKSNTLLFNVDFNKINEDLIRDEGMSNYFSSLVFERSKNIYSKVYEKVSCFIGGSFASDEISQRKTFFEGLKDNIRWGYRNLRWNNYFESNEWDYKIEKDKNNHWSYPNVTFGVPFYSDNYMVAVTWEIGNPNLILGIRGRRNGGRIGGVFSNFIRNNQDFYEGDKYFWFVRKDLRITNRTSAEHVFDILCPIIDYLLENDKWKN